MTSTPIKIWPLAKIIAPETITWGERIMIDDFVFIGAQRKLIIGNYVHIATHSSITGGGECILADFCGLSSGVRIITGTDDFLGGGLTNPCIPSEFRAVRRGRVVIESHAIIGANTVVFPDIVIGEGVAVSAGSVVTKDLEPWGVYAGAPARRVKPRPMDAVLDAEQALYRRFGAPTPSYRLPER
ncbi:MAG TPA: acyltransferase [Betaproteobacteria bacterium]|nr:acyltransferase [Betaproteobacteria bacterium]